MLYLILGQKNVKKVKKLFCKFDGHLIILYKKKFIIKKIYVMKYFIFRSEGQTGVDIGMVDAAVLENGSRIVYSNSSRLIIKISNVQCIITGFCPKGWKCENGKIDNFK